MRRVVMLAPIVLIALFASACSALPGLRVLTGQEDSGGASATSLQQITLVMADKGGGTDPALTAIADRIEAAAGNIDIIEIRQDEATRVFSVDMLFSQPTVDTSTMQGRVALLDAMRRAVELTWQGVMRVSEGDDVLSIRLLGPSRITTLDNGPSFIGVVDSTFSIERSAAASYLTGQRSLNSFYDLIVQGTLSYGSPPTMELYQGQPNHPMVMLPAGA